MYVLNMSVCKYLELNFFVWFPLFPWGNIMDTLFMKNPTQQIKSSVSSGSFSH